MSCVSFKTGSAFTKKRKRMKGTNSTKKVEIKQWNPRYIGEGDTYNGVTLYNLQLYSNDTPVAGSSWMPFQIHMPSVGTNFYQRIGKSIFLKYLRFKGYIRVYNKAVVGCRWRLRLIRTNNYEFESPAGRGVAAIKKYVGHYKNAEAPQDADFTDVATMWNMTRHNFYKTIKNVDNDNIIQSKIIASGYIPVSSVATLSEIRGTLTGNSAGAISLTSKTHNAVLDNGFYCIPLDVKVKCNDYVVEGDIRYYYVLETDCGVGIGYSNDGGLGRSLSTEQALFELSFFIRGYFTDL